jgi:Reverse transcriptase (RNA-dependent DNA polymerase)
VVKGYNRIYDIDYNKTFVPVAKMSTMRTLISMDVNGGCKLHQLDMKNIFLHGDLMENVYMEIPLDFGTVQTVGKVYKSKPIKIDESLWHNLDFILRLSVPHTISRVSSVFP